jgi:omega-6 fatty acid desaturase (delta-12 desaturase)
MTNEAPPGIAARSGLTQQQRLAFANRQIVLPVSLFAALVVLYGSLFFLTLATPSPWAFLLAPVCGLVVGMLFIVGHDACHNSFTASSWLNQTIGRLAFLPSLHGFSLWDLGHNRMHHRYNNVRNWDLVWEPWSSEDYLARGPVRRALYRFYRSPGGVPFYYMTVLWGSYLTFSAPAIYRNLRVIYFVDTALWMLFLAAQCWVAVSVGARFGHGAAASLAIGVVIPFLTWNGLMSVTVYVHHTHPLIPWYRDVAAWQADRGVVNGATHVHFVWPFSFLVLSIMEHNAHHAAPGVPFYNLRRMQSTMEAHENFLTWRFSLRGFLRVCERCKLYDYDLGRWVSFKDAEQRMVQPIGREAAPN